MKFIDFADTETDQTPQRQLNFRQKMVVLAIDLLMVIEVCIGMYMASLTPDSFTTSFVKTFTAALVPTLVVGIILIRRLKTVIPTISS